MKVILVTIHIWIDLVMMCLIIPIFSLDCHFSPNNVHNKIRKDILIDYKHMVAQKLLALFMHEQQTMFTFEMLFFHNIKRPTNLVIIHPSIHPSGNGIESVLAQDWGNSIANTLRFPQHPTKPLIAWKL